MAKIRVESEDIRGMQEELLVSLNLVESEFEMLIEELKTIRDGIDCQHSVKVINRTDYLREEMEKKLRYLRKRLEVLEDIANEYERVEMENKDVVMAIG